MQIKAGAGRARAGVMGARSRNTIVLVKHRARLLLTGAP